MLHKTHQVTVFILLWLSSFYLYAQNIVKLEEDKFSYPLGRKIEILEDRTKQLSLQDILRPDNQSKFKLHNKDIHNQGFTDVDFWMRFQVENNAEADHEWMLRITNSAIDTIHVYILDENNHILQQYQTGDLFTYDTRPLDYRHFLFPIHFHDKKTLTVYLHFEGYYSKQHPMEIIEITQLFQESQTEMIFLITFTGIMFGLLLYNFFIYLSIRDTSYLYYVMYLGFMTLYLFSTNGFTVQFLVPYLPSVGNISHNATATLAIWAAMAFTEHFLKIRTLISWGIWVIKIVGGFALFSFSIVVVSIWYPPIMIPAFPLITASLLSGVVTCFLMGIVGTIKGSRQAKFYLFAWSFLLVGALLVSLRFTGIWSNNLTLYGIQVGCVAEALLLSLGLADKMKVAEMEKRKAQAEAIEALQANEKIIREQNIILEQKVAERTEEINKQKEEIEEKNKAITDSITYAKRIQQAILPSLEDIRKVFEDSFIFFRPRDIVSGDFYYFHQEDNKVVVATVDCTGHGVPGAFMSMIGKELLDQIIQDRNILESDKILNELHKGIRKALKQEETKNRDGMDMSLLVIDLEKKIMEFSGAKNPFVYIKQGELTEVKADKMPIGGEQKEEERIFSKHTILLDASTTVYLFSDGFQDQFGGEQKRKFMLSRMRTLFLEIHQLPFDNQRDTLEDTIVKWCQTGKEKQIDDILVIGLKVA